MDDAGCYVAFPEVRHAILIATVLVVVAIFAIARWSRARREQRQFGVRECAPTSPDSLAAGSCLVRHADSAKAPHLHTATSDGRLDERVGERAQRVERDRARSRDLLLHL
jgi:hypothetical protein